MMIIDVHAHLVTPLSVMGIRTALQISGGQHSIEWLRAMLPQSDIDEAVKKNIAIMDAVGTDIQFLSPRPFSLMHSHPRFADVDLWIKLQNNLIHENVLKHPDRFRGVAALPQVNGQPIDIVFPEMERCIKELGFVGILLNPDPSEGLGNSPTLGDPYWDKLWEKMVEYDVPALIHSASCCGRETYDEHFATEESLAITKLAHSDVFRRFPNIKIIVGHGGGAIPYQIGRWRSHWAMTQSAKLPHIAKYYKELEKSAASGAPRPERPADLETFDDVLRKFYFDTDVHDPDSMTLLFKKVGVDRCMFGTERPGSGGGIDITTGRPLDDLKPTIDALPMLTDADRKALYQDNALRLFTHLPKEITSRCDHG